MRLKAAFEGNLKKYMESEFRAAEKAVTLGIREATQGLKMSMRRQVTSSGLGPRMANTWRGNVYPKGQNSIRSAGLIYTKAARIMEGFEKASVIRSQKGWWLAIPTPHAPKRGVNGKRINPSNFPEGRYGKLRFIYRPQGPSLLVVDKMRVSYSRTTGDFRGFRKASDKSVKSGHSSTVIMFWLVPQVKMPKLITFEGESKQWFNKLPRLILKHWPE